MTLQPWGYLTMSKEKTPLTLDEMEAALALHALRFYMNAKGYEVSQNSKDLEAKLDDYLNDTTFVIGQVESVASILGARGGTKGGASTSDAKKAAAAAEAAAEPARKKPGRPPKAAAAEASAPAKRGRKSKKQRRQEFDQMEAPTIGGVRIRPGDGSTVRLRRGASLTDLAEKIGVDPASLVQVLFNLGEMVNATQSVADDTLQVLGAELNYTIEVVSPEDEDRELLESFDIEFGENAGGEEDREVRGGVRAARSGTRNKAHERPRRVGPSDPITCGPLADRTTTIPRACGACAAPRRL